MANDMEFDEWWEELIYVAKERNLMRLLGDKNSHWDGYNEGNTPAEELDDQWGAGEAR